MTLIASTPRRRRLGYTKGGAAALMWIGVLLPSSGVAQEPAKADAPAAHAAEAQNWSGRVGLGAGLAPAFEGSSDYDLIPMPQLEISWRNWVSIGTRGLSVNVLRNKHVRFGGRLSYNRGRDQDDSAALRGLGDIDPTAEAGIFASLHFNDFTLKADFLHDIADSHGGMTGNLSLAYAVSFGRKFRLSAGPRLGWANSPYTQTYFGVSAAQSARSGLARYDAGSGLKDYGLNATLSYSLNDNWSVVGLVSYKRLANAAADSPIVESPNQVFSGLLLSYRF